MGSKETKGARAEGRARRVRGRGTTRGSLTPAPARGRTRDGDRAGDWRAVLSGASPREVLARLMNGDPLGIRRVVAERLRLRAYLLDADQVQLRAVARCARFAARYRGQPPLECWLAEWVDEALLERVAEELERADAPGGGGLAGGGAVFRHLSVPLGLDPACMRRACARFNALPESERRSFFDLVIDSRSLDAVAGENGASASAVARSARRALDVLLGESARGQHPQRSVGAEMEERS